MGYFSFLSYPAYGIPLDAGGFLTLMIRYGKLLRPDSKVMVSIKYTAPVCIRPILLQKPLMMLSLRQAASAFIIVPQYWLLFRGSHHEMLPLWFDDIIVHAMECTFLLLVASS